VSGGCVLLRAGYLAGAFLACVRFSGAVSSWRSVVAAVRVALAGSVWLGAAVVGGPFRAPVSHTTIRGSQFAKLNTKSVRPTLSESLWAQKSRSDAIRTPTPASRPPLRFLSPTRSGPCRPAGARERASARRAQAPLTPPSPQFFLCYRRARLVRYRARGAGGTLRPAKRPCAAPLPHFRGRRKSQRAKRGE
jgi:hypothetical protein